MQKNIILLVCLLSAITLRAQITTPIKVQPTVTPVAPLKVQPAIKPGLIKMSQVVSVRPQEIRNLCPKQRIMGDHEFDMNELYIEVSISFAGDNGRDSIFNAVVFISAKENGGDHSAVKQRFVIPVYKAPPGYRIERMIANQRSLAFTFNTRDKGREYFKADCVTFGYTLNPASLGFDLHQNMVRSMVILTRNLKGGDDFDENEGDCRCGFKISTLEFMPFQLQITKN